MKPRQSLFIYERREIVVLVILCTMVAFFTFTLGVHLGKRVGVNSKEGISHDLSAIKTLDDEVPNAPELKEQERGAKAALDDAMSQELEEQVQANGLKLEAIHQTELPTKTKSANGGATAHRSIASEPEREFQQRYTLQVGSYPSMNEAKVTSQSLSQLHPVLREAEIAGKGKWYRVLVGEFLTRHDAEEAGLRLRSQHKIQSFMVTKVSKP